MSNISVLPPEIISQILEFLPHRDRLIAALVCKQWHDAAFSPKFCRKMCLNLSSLNRLDVLQGGLAYKRCRNASLRWFEIDEISDDDRLLITDFLKNSPLEWLGIDGKLSFVKWILDEILPYMKTLISLDFNCAVCHSNDIQNLRINNANLQYLILDDFLPSRNFQINCPNLIGLNTMVNFNKYDGLRHNGVQPRHQGLDNVFLAGLSNCIFEKFKRLQLKFTLSNNDLEQLCGKVPNLEHLNLQFGGADIYTGAGFSALKNLTRLSLNRMNIDAAALFETVYRMKCLKILNIEMCIFVANQGTQRLSSESVTDFALITEKHEVVIPCFPHLKRLTVLYRHQPPVDILGVICHAYPQLQKLNFGVNPGLIGTVWLLLQKSCYRVVKFYTQTSIAHLDKLKSMQSIQFNRMALQNIDWTLCSSLRIQKLRLYCCSIDGNTAQQVAQIFPNLREYFLDNSYLRQPSEVFDIDEHCSKGLRFYLPNCKVSYYDCHIETQYGTCGGRRVSPH